MDPARARPRARKGGRMVYGAVFHGAGMHSDLNRCVESSGKSGMTSVSGVF